MLARTGGRRTAWMAFWLAGVMAAAADAQEPAPQDKKYQDLEKRVRELEESSKEKADRTEGAAWYDRLKILGFCDATYAYHARADGNLDGGDNSSFGIGQFDLFFTAQLPEKFSFLAELNFESDTSNTLGVDLERVQISYRLADELTISAGRYHTALGYWNQTYHHGAILYPTVDRPGFYDFEDRGGLLPVHLVGLEASGRFDVSLGALEFTANLSNGRGREPDEIQKRVDSTIGKSVGLNLGFRPDAVPGLRVGGAAFFDEIPPDPATPGRADPVRESIFGGYAVYTRGPVEVLAEYFRMVHQGERGSPDYD